MATNLRSKLAKSDYSPLFVTLATLCVNFYRLVAIFDRRLPIWPSFADRSRVVDMATNFRVKNRQNRPTHLHSSP